MGAKQDEISRDRVAESTLLRNRPLNTLIRIPMELTRVWQATGQCDGVTGEKRGPKFATLVSAGTWQAHGERDPARGASVAVRAAVGPGRLLPFMCVLCEPKVSR